MVGLFWIDVDEDTVYLGAPPDILGRTVLVSDAGLEGVGNEQAGSWAWAEVREVAVLGAPVRSAVRRSLSMAGTLLLTAVSGGPVDDAPAMTVRVDTADGQRELTTSTAAAGGYGQDEFDLSQVLLDRFADGSARPSTLVEWARTHSGGTPHRADREALLRAWACQ
ncbi:hypothetical protein U9R90_06385 [Streptomyces sp. E11-3]|uniref:hypothetical protein n=1 Tax=Streptomyces sp. E11-3 TaxID=3110112 RepID=UPI00397EA848